MYFRFKKQRPLEDLWYIRKMSFSAHLDSPQIAIRLKVVQSLVMIHLTPNLKIWQEILVVFPIKEGIAIGRLWHIRKLAFSAHLDSPQIAIRLKVVQSLEMIP